MIKLDSAFYLSPLSVRIDYNHHFLTYFFRIRIETYKCFCHGQWPIKHAKSIVLCVMLFFVARLK